MLPRLILICDRFTDEQVARRVVRAVRAGVKWVHLRDHEATQDAFVAASRALVRSLKAENPRVMISINGRFEVARALSIHYHTGRFGALPARDAAENEMSIGYSAHEVEDLKLLELHRMDYLFYSPIFATSSKPGQPGRGVLQLRKFCQAAAQVPVYALGGVTPEKITDCLEAGAYGIAVLSGILGAEGVEEAVAAYTLALEKGEV